MVFLLLLSLFLPVVLWSMDNSNISKELTLPTYVVEDIVNSPLDTALITRLKALETTPDFYQNIIKSEMVDKHRVALSQIHDISIRFSDLGNPCFIAMGQDEFLVVLTTDNNLYITSSSLSELTNFKSFSFESQNAIGLSVTDENNVVIAYIDKVVILKFISNTIIEPFTISGFEKNLLCRGVNAYGTRALITSKNSDQPLVKIVHTNFEPTVELEPFAQDINDTVSFSTDKRNTKALCITQSGKAFLLLLARQKKPVLLEGLEPCLAGDISSDGCWAVLQHPDSVSMVNAITGTKIYTIRTAGIKTIKLSNTSNIFAIGTSNGIVILVDIPTCSFKPIGNLKHAIQALSFNKNNNSLVIGLKEKGICCRQLTTQLQNKLSLKQIIALIKIQQVSEDGILSLEYFKNVFDTIQDPDLKTSIDIYLKKHALCPICYTQPVNCCSDCKHYFCQDCLKKVIQENTKCPLCRSMIRSYIAY